MQPLNYNRRIIKDYVIADKIVLKKGTKILINHWYSINTTVMTNITYKRKQYNIPYHYISIS